MYKNLKNMQPAPLKLGMVEEPAVQSMNGASPVSVSQSQYSRPYQNMFENVTNAMTTLTSNNVASSRTQKIINEINNLDQEIN